MMKSLTVNQNPSEFTGRGVKHVAQVTRSSNMMEDIFKKGLHSLLLCPLVCNTSSLISVLFLNHSSLFTRRLLWMDHVIKAIKHLQTSHGKQMMRLESTAQRTRRNKKRQGRSSHGWFQSRKSEEIREICEGGGRTEKEEGVGAAGTQKKSKKQSMGEQRRSLWTTHLDWPSACSGWTVVCSLDWMLGLINGSDRVSSNDSRRWNNALEIRNISTEAENTVQNSQKICRCVNRS